MDCRDFCRSRGNQRAGPRGRVHPAAASGARNQRSPALPLKTSTVAPATVTSRARTSRSGAGRRVCRRKSLPLQGEYLRLGGRPGTREINKAALAKPDHRQQDCDHRHKGQQGRQHLSGQFGSSSPVFEHSADHGRLLAAPRRPQTRPPRPAVPLARCRRVEGTEDSIARSHRGQTAWQPTSQRQFSLERLLPSQVAIVLHPGESWSPTPMSMFCRPASPALTSGSGPSSMSSRTNLPVDNLEATRLQRQPARRHANRNRGPAVATPVPYDSGPEVGPAIRRDLDAHLRLR